MDRIAIVTEARRWLGTPWLHQQSVRGVGCDCIGFVRGVFKAVGAHPADFESRPEVAKYRGYGPNPDGRLRIAMREFLIPIHLDQAQPGDVLMIRFTRDPQHVGLLGNYVGGGLSMIHALNTQGVVEHRLDDGWRARVVDAFRAPGVDDEAPACCGSCSTGGSCGA